MPHYWLGVPVPKPPKLALVPRGPNVSHPPRWATLSDGPRLDRLSRSPGTSGTRLENLSPIGRKLRRYGGPVQADWPTRRGREYSIPGDNGQAPWDPTPLRLPTKCDSRKVSVITRSGCWQRDGVGRDLRLQLPRLFQSHRLPKGRVNRWLRVRQADHSEAQKSALGTWQHPSSEDSKYSFACRCYGCTGRGDGARIASRQGAYFFAGIIRL